LQGAFEELLGEFPGSVVTGFAFYSDDAVEVFDGYAVDLKAFVLWLDSRDHEEDETLFLEA